MKINKISIIVRVVVIFSLLAGAGSALAASKGLSRAAGEDSVHDVLYKNSYALLIGVSDYTAGWPDLESIPGELDALQKVLQQKGFKTVRVDNPDARQLERSFADFIDQYGFDENNRLLFFYSGHGHTMNSGSKGYLVPTDAPNPETDPKNFKRKALDMSQILAWSRQMESKHGLFLFDSCFSGTIFKQRNLLNSKPSGIDRWTSSPVRQFITAGSAGETVPAASTFTPAVIDAINGRADLNKDGYVIGTELGLYLQSELPQYVAQTPQYGKINDYNLSRGDFVFVVEQSPPTPKVAVKTALAKPVAVLPAVVPELAPPLQMAKADTGLDAAKIQTAIATDKPVIQKDKASTDLKPQKQQLASLATVSKPAEPTSGGVYRRKPLSRSYNAEFGTSYEQVKYKKEEDTAVTTRMKFYTTEVSHGTYPLAASEIVARQPYADFSYTKFDWGPDVNSASWSFAYRYAKPDLPLALGVKTVFAGYDYDFGDNSAYKSAKATAIFGAGYFINDKKLLTLSYSNAERRTQYVYGSNSQYNSENKYNSTGLYLEYAELVQLGRRDFVLYGLSVGKRETRQTDFETTTFSSAGTYFIDKTLGFGGSLSMDMYNQDRGLSQTMELFVSKYFLKYFAAGLRYQMYTEVGDSEFSSSSILAELEMRF